METGVRIAQVPVGAVLVMGINLCLGEAHKTNGVEAGIRDAVEEEVSEDVGPAVGEAVVVVEEVFHVEEVVVADVEEVVVAAEDVEDLEDEEVSINHSALTKCLRHLQDNSPRWFIIFFVVVTLLTLVKLIKNNFVSKLRVYL